jgi:hypothetical protein
MKNKIYFLGWIGCILTIAGGLSKILHWPGAGVLLTSGLTFLSFVFFPAALVSNYKGTGKKSPLLYVAIFLALFLQTMGALFKIQQWPGSGILMIAGILSPVFIFLPVFLYYDSKSEGESLTNFFSILYLLAFISVMSAFLSVRVDKNLVTSSIESMNLTDMSNYYSVKKSQCYTILLNNREAPAFIQAEKIKDHSEKIDYFIHSIDNSLMNGNKCKFNDLEDQEQPLLVMFQQKKGEELYQNIVSFRKLLKGSTGNNETNKFISILLNVETNNENKWEENEFKRSNVAFSMLRLKTIKDNIALAEIAVLNDLIKNARD